MPRPRPSSGHWPRGESALQRLEFRPSTCLGINCMLAELFQQLYRQQLHFEKPMKFRIFLRSFIPASHCSCRTTAHSRQQSLLQTAAAAAAAAATEAASRNSRLAGSLSYTGCSCSRFLRTGGVPRMVETGVPGRYNPGRAKPVTGSYIFGFKPPGFAPSTRVPVCLACTPFINSMPHNIF